jgi:hypothetical protein
MLILKKTKIIIIIRYPRIPYIPKRAAEKGKWPRIT